MRDAGLQCYIWGQCQVIWTSIMTNIIICLTSLTLINYWNAIISLPQRNFPSTSNVWKMPRAAMLSPRE